MFIINATVLRQLSTYHEQHTQTGDYHNNFLSQFSLFQPSSGSRDSAEVGAKTFRRRSVVIITARVRTTTGRYRFHRCLSVHRGGQSADSAGGGVSPVGGGGQVSLVEGGVWSVQLGGWVSPAGGGVSQGGVSQDRTPE